MIKLMRGLAAAALVLAWIMCPQSSRAAGSFSCATGVSSLYGWYGMLIAGATTASTPAAKYLAGALLFNGAGAFTANNIYGGSNSDTSATGTYAVNSDCTLTLSMNIGTAPVQTYTVALKANNEAVGIETDAGAVATIDLQAQYAVYTPGLNFTQSSLAGTFAAACIGPLSGSSDLNLVTFAAGSLAGTDPFNDGGSFTVANNPYSGTYQVNTDGTFFGTLTVDSTPFDFFGVISNSGNEIEYFYTNVAGNTATAAFASCVGKQ